MADEEKYLYDIIEESIIYIWSKFQLDTCMFDTNILLTKFGPGFWYRVPGVGSGFYSSQNHVCRVSLLFHTPGNVVRGNQTVMQRKSLR